MSSFFSSLYKVSPWDLLSIFFNLANLHLLLAADWMNVLLSESHSFVFTLFQNCDYTVIERANS